MFKSYKLENNDRRRKKVGDEAAESESIILGVDSSAVALNDLAILDDLVHTLHQELSEECNVI